LRREGLAPAGHGWSLLCGGPTNSRCGRLRGLLLQHGPVEGVVVLVVQRAEEDPEQLAQVHVVGGLFKAKSAAVVQIHRKLGRETFAEDLNGGGHLFLADLFVFLLLGGGL